MGNLSTTTATTSTTAKVTIAQLCRSKDFQVRAKLCFHTVQRYATAIKAGQELPPLQVALVDGVPCLVDGYHRAEALDYLGYVEAEAVITETTRHEAQWMAATANLTHGLPLKTRELREVFRVYIRTGRHKMGRGRLKSYREIAQDLGRPHTTIRGWMEKDFKKLFNQYGDANRRAKGDEDIIRALPPPRNAWVAIDHLDAVRNAFQETACAESREAIRVYLKALSDDLLADWKNRMADF
ncbi:MULTISPECIES: ParB N-terminal domain-containing protein [unclassified Pseudomonas]|uniref:ParB N-terminal domain-containing protein n=1 Tax=unclassified Pseudomonas TaxID=196821 RepID=UPI0020064359|nr:MULTISPECIES: ParB N-terminal domain-containing protein [unclassified Pseudomonas]MCK6190989.1 ParB N-terminal domain-containing protein [Pseudomonas sp. EYE_354]WLH67230.1 ParB N-terminal domain-containing protein [Pseudomonas sp. FP2309]